MTGWLDEIDLDPSHPWLRMGTRALGDRRWLVLDDDYDTDLALKAELLAGRHDEVFAARSGSEAPGAELEVLVAEDLHAQGWTVPATAPDCHPLDRAGRTVQEDLCLLQRRNGAWHLDAASLCFPSRWRLAEKIGRPLAEVHAPVDGYTPVLVDRVEGLLDDLVTRPDDRPVRRRNWFIHPDGARFQPDRPDVDPVRVGEGCLTGLWVRSERQTLRRLPRTGWVVFTIRIQQTSVGEMVADQRRRAALTRLLLTADPAALAHRGMAPAQVQHLLAVLT